MRSFCVGLRWPGFLHSSLSTESVDCRLGFCPLLIETVDRRVGFVLYQHNRSIVARGVVGLCSDMARVFWASFGRMLRFRATFGHCQRLRAIFGRSSHLEWRNVARKRLRCPGPARKRLRCLDSARTPAMSGTSPKTLRLPFASRCATRRFGRRCRESRRCPGGAAIRCARTYCPCYRRFGSS